MKIRKAQKHVIVMSPLANPVVGAIFTSVKSAGMAARSIIDSILKSDNSGLNGTITRVTPQGTYDNSRF